MGYIRMMEKKMQTTIESFSFGVECLRKQPPWASYQQVHHVIRSRRCTMKSTTFLVRLNVLDDCHVTATYRGKGGGVPKFWGGSDDGSGDTN